MSATEVTPQTILDFWYSDRVSKLWFNSTPGFDQELREKFLDVYEQAARGDLDEWQQTASGALALAIILDQFPLNMFRGQPKSFATEAKARAIARNAIERGLDAQLPKEQLAFLYMPLMHSEDPADQDKSVELFEKAGLDKNLRFARHHRELIRRFGRFPHRNAILGRESTAEEIEYLNSKEAFTG
jgi:uncharacterized protein (DUF924 family)